MAALGLHCFPRDFASFSEQGLLFGVMYRLATAVASVVEDQGSRHEGFRSCGTQAQWFCRMALVAPWHVGSSHTRDQTRVSCIGR